MFPRLDCKHQICLILVSLTIGLDGKKIFEQFCIASGLEKDEQKKQVNTLLYCMGEKAEATDADKGDYSKVLEKFNEFFNVRKNVIYEQARFNRCTQQQGERAEQFIMSLYKSRRKLHL